MARYRRVALIVLFLLVAPAALLWFSSPEVTAQIVGPGQKPCGPSDDLSQRLGLEFKETPISYGVVEGGALLEVYASEAGATWTVLVQRPDGISCIIASGVSWQWKLDMPS